MVQSTFLTERTNECRKKILTLIDKHFTPQHKYRRLLIAVIPRLVTAVWITWKQLFKKKQNSKLSLTKVVARRKHCVTVETRIVVRGEGNA